MRRGTAPSHAPSVSVAGSLQLSNESGDHASGQITGKRQLTTNWDGNSIVGTVTPTATASTGTTEPSGHAFASTRHRIIELDRGFAIALGFYPLQLGHAPGLIPIRNIDVGILIDKASVGRAEVGESDVSRK